jgi:hypothetical protein
MYDYCVISDIVEIALRMLLVFQGKTFIAMHGMVLVLFPLHKFAWLLCFYSLKVGKKVKSVCLTKHHAMKMYWGSAGLAPCIL